MGVAHVLGVEVEHHISNVIAVACCDFPAVRVIRVTPIRLQALIQRELDRNVLKVCLECRSVPVLGDAGLHRTRQAVGQCALVVQIGVP